MKKTYYYDKKQQKMVELKKEEALEFLGKNPKPRIHIIPDIEPYFDENMGHEPVFVKSRRHKNQLLKERGLGIKWKSAIDAVKRLLP